MFDLVSYTYREWEVWSVRVCIYEFHYPQRGKERFHLNNLHAPTFLITVISFEVIVCFGVGLNSIEKCF